MSPDGVNTNAANSARKLVLKFEYDGQQYELISLTTADTVGNLRAVISSMLNIDDFKRITVKTLQPTKLIDFSDHSKPLSEIFHQTREKIVVEDVASKNKLSRAEYSSYSDSIAGHSQHSILSNKPNTAKHHKLDRSAESTLADVSDPINTNSFNDMNPSDLVQEQQPQFSLPESSGSNESPIRQRKLPRDQSDYPVCSSTGYLLRHPVPSNNSCLFISVHFCLTNGQVDDQIGRSMRKIIADTVASDTEHFDDALLGKSNADYCKWILDDNNWGGAIELSILCKYYATEIVAIDVKNTILNRFGEDSHYSQRMLLLYDGLHYDPLKFQPLDDSQQIQTLFSTENLEVLSLAEELAREAKQSHLYTDMKTIIMRCEVCNLELDVASAKTHAKETGHERFTQEMDRTTD